SIRTRARRYGGRDRRATLSRLSGISAARRERELNRDPAVEAAHRRFLARPELDDHWFLLFARVEFFLLPTPLRHCAVVQKHARGNARVAVRLPGAGPSCRSGREATRRDHRRETTSARPGRRVCSYRSVAARG